MIESIKMLFGRCNHFVSSGKYCLILFTTIFSLRLMLIAATFNGNDKTAFWEDAVIAENLVSGKGYSMAYDVLPRYIMYGSEYINPPRTAVKPPLYPLFIAANYVLFGVRNFLALYVVQAMLASFSPIVLYLATRRFMKEGWARLLAAAFALYPSFLMHPCVRIEASWLLLLLLCIGVYILSSAAVSNRWLVSAGMLTGLVVLLDPVPAPALAASFFYRVHLFSATRTRKLLSFMMIILCALGIMLPWQIRNIVVFNKVIMKSSTASSLLYGFHQNSLPLPALPENWDTLRGKDVFSEEEAAWQVIKDHMAANPELLPKHIVLNLKRYYGFSAPPNWSLSASLMALIPQWGLQLGSLMVLLIAACSRFRPTSDIIKTLTLWCLTTIGITTLTYGFVGAWNERYKFPLLFALLVFFFVLSFEIWSAWHKGFKKSTDYQ